MRKQRDKWIVSGERLTTVTNEGTDGLGRLPSVSLLQRKEKCLKKPTV
jgi:hypothetical protein